LRKKRDVQRGQAKGENNRVGGGARGEIFGENLVSFGKAAGTIQKQNQMVSGDARDLRIFLRAGRVGAFEVLESRIIIGSLVFAEAEEIQSAGGVGREGENFLKCRDGVATLVAVVKKRAEIPPAFRPAGAKREGTSIELRSFRGAVGVSSSSGGLGQRIEIGTGLLGAGRIREQSTRNRHEYEKQREL